MFYFLPIVINSASCYGKFINLNLYAMKVFKLVFLVLFAGLFFMACSQEDGLIQKSTDLNDVVKNEVIKMVPFKGNFSSAPISPEPIPCTVQGQPTPIEALVYNAVSGNATHLGKIDPMRSPLIVVNCILNDEESITTTLEMTFRNKKGHGIKVYGDVVLNIAGPTAGYFEIIEGYGKFEGASGWIETAGMFDISQGKTVYKAEGLISQPNH